MSSSTLPQHHDVKISPPNKRLIVLCDGTGQNSYKPDPRANPTNVTRLSRALAPKATVDGNIIEQIIYYQPGVGTAPLEVMTGGARGLGLSANVRAAYGFLAHNYVKGDHIYFFGFSRGAYTARAVAGLVTALGLLTKRGMDRFPEVYEDYYGHLAKRDNDHQTISPKLRDSLSKTAELNEDAMNAVQIVAVFDTVGFHAENVESGEMPEFGNQRLSIQVKYGYHALALDEERKPFEPTLWQVPSDEDLTPVHGKRRHKEFKQVWFSGVHADIGGGMSDPRLSDITLAWMIAQCSGPDKLEFTDVPPEGITRDPNDYYLFDFKDGKQPATGWATSEGVNKYDGLFWTDVSQDISKNQGHIADQLKALGSDTIGAAGSMLASIVENINHRPRRPMTMSNTQEEIHRSIRERNISGHGANGVAWPCQPLAGTHDGTRWALKGSVQSLPEAQPDAARDALEDSFRGRIRKLPLPV